MGYDEILSLAIKRCSNDYIQEWNHFYNIYPFTTENISGYIDNFNLNGNSLLTVGSSGDQIFNAVLMGINDVAQVDINPFAKYYYYLKMACIIELNMDEFLLFLRYKNYPKAFKDNVLVFNEYIFIKIRDTLKCINYDSFMFWDNLFQLYPRDIVRDHLFSIDEREDKFIKSCNLYLSDDKVYNKLRNRVKNIEPTFINGDIFEADIDKKFDNIWLSNIATYGLSYEQIQGLFLKYSNYLNMDGTLLLSYLYDTTINSKYNDNWEAIYNIKKILDMFKEYNLDIKSFKGIYDIIHDINRIKDSVLIYKKR